MIEKIYFHLKIPRADGRADGRGKIQGKNERSENFHSTLVEMHYDLQGISFKKIRGPTGELTYGSYTVRY